MIFKDALHSIIDAHISAWNAKNANSMEHLFTESAELESNYLNNLFQFSSQSRIIGKTNILAYYGKLFKSPFYQKFTKEEVIDQGKTIIVRLKTIQSQQYLHSTFSIDEYGKLNNVSFENMPVS